MDLRRLRVLTAVAEHGRFSAAARALHTVQSNVSSHISKLEEELGAVLVDRSVGVLTEAGRVVLARARRIDAELAAMSSDVASLTGHVTGSAHFGIIGTSGRWLLPHLLDEMRRRHAAVKLNVIDATTISLLRLLEAGELEFAVINTPLDHDELISTPLFTEQIVVIAPNGHELADGGDREVTFAELSGHPLLLGPPASVLRAHIDMAASRQGVTLQSVAHLDGIRLSATLAFQGYGPAVAPITSIPSWAERGDWKVLTVEHLPPREVGIAVRRRGILAAPARAARDQLRLVVAARARSMTGVRAA